MAVLSFTDTADMRLLMQHFLDGYQQWGGLVSASSTGLVVEAVDEASGQYAYFTFSGSGFGSPGANGLPSTGTIAGLSVSWTLGGAPHTQLTDLSVSWSAMATALSSGRAADFASLVLSGNDTITGSNLSSGDDTLFGYGGLDTIEGRDGQDLLYGGDGADILRGGDETTFVASRAMGDGADGGAGDDNIDGGSGDDFLVGGVGADQIVGGAGADFIFDAAVGIVEQVRWSDLEFGYVREFSPTDRLATDTSVDILNGGLGDDIIVAGLGDQVEGGDGYDLLQANFSGRGSGLVLNLSTNAAAALVAAGIGSINGVEDFVVDGSGHADTITGRSVRDILRGGGGGDTLEGGDGNDNLVGASHTLMAAVGSQLGVRFDDGAVDTLRGGDGDDTITAGAGDIVDGGTGADTLNINLVAMTHGVTLDLSGPDPFSVIASQSGGGISNVEVIAGLATTDHADTVLHTGAYRVFLNGGNDIYTGGAASQTVEAGSGEDIVRGEGGNDTVYGGIGADWLLGGDGADVLHGDTDLNSVDEGPGSGDDRLEGGAGNDLLYGNRGDDVLIAGTGSDQGDGGYGYDILDYSTSAVAIVAYTDYPEIGPAGPSETPAVHVAQTGEDEDLFFAMEELIGSAFDDQIVSQDLVAVHGGGGDDTISGFGSLYGDDGDDFLESRWIGDHLAGGDGFDTVQYSGGYNGPNASLTINRITGVNTGEALDDTFESIEAFVLTQRDDGFVGSDAAETVDGHGGADVLGGGGGDDVLVGGLGADTLTGGAGSDRFVLRSAAESTNDAARDVITDFVSAQDVLDFSAAGSDRVTIQRSGSHSLIYFGAMSGGIQEGQVRVSNAVVQGYDLIVANADLRMLGDGGANTLTGHLGNDLIEGGGGADIINGAAGADTLHGGTGNDRFDISSASHSTLEAHDRIMDFTTGSDRLNLGGLVTAGYTAISVTRTADGSSFVHFGLATGPAAGVVEAIGQVNGQDLALGGQTLALTFNGSSVADQMSGAGGADTLSGGAGDDILDGGLGDDDLSGGSGADTLIGGYGVDTARYSDATSGVKVYLNTGTGGAWAAGDTYSSMENVIGSNHADLLVGDGANNYLHGGGGADEVKGGAGNDQLLGAAGDDVLEGGDGNDNLAGGDNRDTLQGDAGDDVLNGGAGVDKLFAGAGADHLIGGADNDKLNGGSDNDILDGGQGNDILTGGSGDDLFVFRGASGSDTITDFRAGAGLRDVISFSTSLFVNLADVKAHTTNDGLGNCVISKNGVTILLEGVTINQLVADDFEFVAAAPVLDLPGKGGDALTIPFELDPFDPLILPTGLDNKATFEEAPLVLPGSDAFVAEAPDQALGARPAVSRDDIDIRDYAWVV